MTVALSGDGGDESFAGYDFRYVPHALEQRARRSCRGGRPGGAARPWRGLAALAQRCPKPLRVGTLLENVGRDPADAYYPDLCFMKPAAARRCMGRPPTTDPRDSPVYEAVTAPYRRCTSPSDVQRSQYADLKVYLPNDVLVKVDRMSMLHSLEVRCPAARSSRRGVRVPDSGRRKMPRLKGKRLLRPREATAACGVATCRRRASPCPLGRGSPDHSRRWKAEVLATAASRHPLVDRAHLAGLFLQHRRHETDHGYTLWCLWVFERWHAQQGARKTV